MFQIFKMFSKMLDFLQCGEGLVIKSDAKEMLIQYNVPKLHKNDTTKQVII